MRYIQTIILTGLGFVVICLLVALWYIPAASRPSYMYLADGDGRRNNDVIRDVGPINQDAHRLDFLAMHKQGLEENRNDENSGKDF